MTATDTTFAGGRVGFGSFDNYGRVRDLVALGVRNSDTTWGPTTRGGSGADGAAGGNRQRPLIQGDPHGTAVGRKRPRNGKFTQVGWATAAAGALAVALIAPLPSAGGATFAAAEPTPISDPIPEDPLRSNLGLVLEEYHQFPKTEPTPPPTDSRLVRHNRINFIGEVPDGTGRMYVPDLNGPLYLVEGRRAHVYLDMKARVPALLLGRRPRLRLRVRHVPPGVRGERPRSTRCTPRVRVRHGPTPTSYPSQTPLLDAPRHHRVDGRRPRGQPFRGTHREVLRLGFAWQIHAIQQIDFNPTAKPRRRVTTGCCTSPPATAASVSTPTSRRHGQPVRQDPADRPRRQQRAGRRVRHPGDQPVRRRQGAIGEIFAVGMRDPHRFSLGRRRPAPDVPRPHRPARHRGGLRGARRRQLRLEPASRDG